MILIFNIARPQPCSVDLGTPCVQAARRMGPPCLTASSGATVDLCLLVKGRDNFTVGQENEHSLSGMWSNFRILSIYCAGADTCRQLVTYAI